jgi:hypothetical protein
MMAFLRISSAGLVQTNGWARWLQPLMKVTVRQLQTRSTANDHRDEGQSHEATSVVAERGRPGA